MSTIPLPERGQPIDTNYIYQITEAVNNLSQQISPATYKYVTVDTQGLGKQSVKASEARIIGGYKEVINNTYMGAGSERPFSYTFSNDFKFAPVVTATPLNISGTPAGSNVSVILTNVSTTSVDGIVRFNANGEVSIAINLIMIGIPN